MNKIISFCLIGIISSLSIKTKAQGCSGDACSVVRQIAIAHSNAFKYTNTSSNRSVKVGIKPAIFGGPPGNEVWYSLGPGASTNIGGAYVGNYDAIFTSPPPPGPATPPVPTRAPKFGNGYYRIKNISTNGYIHLQRGPSNIQPQYHFVVCDKDVTSTSDDAIWMLTVKTKVPVNASANEEETYQLMNKAATGFYFVSFNVDATHLIALTQQNPLDFMQWEIALVPGTTNYQIRGHNQGYVFQLSSAQPKTIEFSNPLGTPNESLWILERAN